MRKILKISALLLVLGAPSVTAFAQEKEEEMATMPKPIVPPQHTVFAIHFTSPLGLLSKAGVKAEYRFNPQNSLLAGINGYYGFYPGYQAALEYRHYFHKKPKEKAENFIYGKLGVGRSEFSNDGPFGLWGPYYSTQYNSYYGYSETKDLLLAGAGVGRHFNFGAFFMEINGGLKATLMDPIGIDDNYRMFYITGPGAILDLHFNFGFQF